MNDDIFYKDRFVWSKKKNDGNRRKHHISFETASLVFDDPFYTEKYDEDNSNNEERFKITGSITGLINNILVTVSVTYRGDLIRILSARDADPVGIGGYYEQFTQYFEGEDED
jgi:uncharacterized DUF497 family protein